MRFLMLTALLICVVSLAHAEPGEKYIDVQHDAHRGVTCWILNDKAISCLPDSSLLQQATSASLIDRASQASATQENGVLQAAPHLQGEEAFQL